MYSYSITKLGLDYDKDLLTSFDTDAELSFNTKSIDKTLLIESIKHTYSLDNVMPLETITAKINLLDNLQIR